jgi:hypothetical protein
MGPIGIIIGMNVTGSCPLVVIIFLSLSGGTFLYIACTEIVSMEFAKPGYKVAKGISLLVGIVVISLLWLMESTREANETEIAAILRK